MYQEAKDQLEALNTLEAELKAGLAATTAAFIERAAAKVKTVTDWGTTEAAKVLFDRRRNDWAIDSAMGLDDDLAELLARERRQLRETIDLHEGTETRKWQRDAAPARYVGGL